MSASISDLLERLQQFVRHEADRQYFALERQWSRPLNERVARGWAIEGLSVNDINKGIIHLSCQTNQSRFREGDLLVLHQSAPQDPNALHVDLLYDGETTLEANLIRGNETFLLVQPDGWVADQDWFDSSPFYLSALETAADSLRGRSIILPLLQGSLIPKIDFARYERAVNMVSDTGLNESQVEAVAIAYAADLLHLIQGPPGTGKTLMLAYLARLLVEDGQRVLVTALTHRAIHNALNKIPLVDNTIPVCKIGEARHAGDLNVETFATFDESHFGDISTGYVVGATPFALQTRRLANVEFDVVLFDEASQITLPLAIMGMLGGDKYVFIGDENQLPPVTMSFDGEEAAQASIFSYLSGRGNETMLNITYRLNDVLTAWPSRTFYRSELKPSQEASGRRLQLAGPPTRWDFVLDPKSPTVFVDLCQRNTTVRSRREAEMVVELVLALLDHQIPPEEIGVVVPYRAQSRLIRSLLRRIIGQGVTLEKLAVDTVERMQGQEREVVLVSFTTTSLTFGAQMANFLLQPQRLNVSVTRPRTKLILIGSHTLLEVDKIDPETREIIGLLKDLIDGCLYLTIPDGSLV
jgi:DNA replication ATP-dependent helicase Dna2